MPKAIDLAPGVPQIHDEGMASLRTLNPISPTLSIKTAVQAAGLIVAATAVVFGTVLVLGLTVPAVRSHIPSALAIAIPVHALLALTAQRWICTRHRITWAELGFTRPTIRLLHLLWQIPAALFALIAVQGGALLLVGDNASSASERLDSAVGLGPLTALLMFLGAAVLTPLWEEIFFRGILFGAVRARWGTGWAVVAAAIVFAIAHGVPILLPYLVTMGLALGLLRAFHRSIWGPLALHITVNVIASASFLGALT